MTRKISLIIGIAVTALAFGVPTAFGERQLVGAVRQRRVLLRERAGDARLRAGDPRSRRRDPGEAPAPLGRRSRVLLRERAGNARLRPVIHDHGDATEAKLLLQSPAMEIVRDHGDATQAKLVERGSTSVGSSDQVRLDPNRLSTPTVSASSGSEIQWPQLGIGFGLGILLVAGLWLAMRMTKSRPLAQ